MPLARVERALQDAVVQEGEDAIFSLELSALVRGAWFLNGARVQEEEEEEGRRCCIWHSKTEHALQIRGARLTENGAEVRFVAHGLQDVATLHVQGEALAGEGVRGMASVGRTPETMGLGGHGAGIDHPHAGNKRPLVHAPPPMSTFPSGAPLCRTGAGGLCVASCSAPVAAWPVSSAALAPWLPAGHKGRHTLLRVRAHAALLS